MAVFFKLGTTGERAYVAKTLLSKDITRQEFENKVEEYTIEEFLSMLPEKLANKIAINVNRIKTLNEEMKKTLKENKIVLIPETDGIMEAFQKKDKMYI